MLGCLNSGSNSLSSGSAPSSCQLPAALVLSNATLASSSQAGVSCHPTLLTSFLNYTAPLHLSTSQLLHLSSPFSSPSTPGAILADQTFTGYSQCVCGSATPVHSWDVNGTLSCSAAQSGGGNAMRDSYIAAIVVVALAPWLLIGTGMWLFIK
ncbi:MAG: hypothetical protein WDW38_001483 [Sanguina aurantia]